VSVSMREEDPRPLAHTIGPAPASSVTMPTALAARIEHQRKQVLPSDLRASQERRGDTATAISISCVVLGVILYFGVTRVVSGLGLGVVGVILMVAGGFGMVLSDIVLARVGRARIGERH
jgi:hypothetical protein